MTLATSPNSRRCALALAIAGIFGSAYGNPTAPTVVSGSAVFSQQGSLYTITNTPNTIIDWRSFSIAAGEITRFIQENGGSRVLNRITGQDPSQILGSLQSNGKVFLINPNGIIFGAGASVDVNGLVASSLNISNADFLAGKNVFSSASDAGAVVNRGNITTPAGGQIFLIAPSVENSGVISAPNGDVVLAAGRSVQLFDSADPNVQVVVSAPADQAINLGSIVAAGGRVGVFGALVNQRGNINADSAVRGENGKIVLKSSDTTLVEAGSTTSARGSDQNEGGEILLLGEQVGITGNAVVDASGEAGGGKVLVGGDYQGGNAAVMNARATYVGQDAVLRADASGAAGNGNGGTVVVWSEEATRMYGTAMARGGAAGGNGGVVETSGNYLDVAGARVDTSAAKGRIGNWLLDPYDIEVVSGRGGTLSDVLNFGAGSATGTTSIGADLISEAASNVVLQAKHDIYFNSAIFNDSSVSLTAQAGNNIQVNAPIIMFGGITLSANAAASGTASGIGGITIANLAGDNTLDTLGGNLSLSGSYITINGGIALQGGRLDARVNTAGGTLAFGSGSSIDNGGIQGSQLSFTADNMTFNGAAGSLQADAISLSAYTASRGIVLGLSDSNRLSLNTTGLNTLRTEALTIGNSGGQGVSIGGTVDLSGSTAGSDRLTLSGKTISIDNAFKTDANLILDASGGTLTGAGAITAGNLSAYGNSVTLTGANAVTGINGEATVGNFTFNAAGGLAVNGDLTGATGITLSAGGNITQDFTAVLSTPLLNVSTPGLVDLVGFNRIDAVSASNVGGLALNNNVGITLNDVSLSGTRPNGGIQLTAYGDVVVSGTVDAKTQDIVLSGINVVGSGKIAAAHLSANAGNSVSLTGANAVGTVSGTAANGGFSYNGAGDYSVDNITGGISIALAGTGNISQAVGSSILTAPSLSVSTPGTVNLLGNNDIAALAAPNVGSLSFKSSTDLNLGVLSLTSQSSGAISVTAPTILVGARINGGTQQVSLSGGTVTVNAAGSAGIFDIGADVLNLNADLSASIAARLHPYSSGYGMKIGSTTACSGNCMAVGDLWHMVTPTLVLGSTDTSLNVGDITVDSISGAGSTPSSINAVTTRIGLLSNAGNITQTGTINVSDLALATAGIITLTNSGNTVSRLAATQGGTGFLYFSNTGSLSIARLLGGTSTANALFDINGINSNGTVSLDVSGNIGSAGAAITANALVLNSTQGVGSGGNPLVTRVGRLAAVNTAGSDANAPINIANTGPLSVQRVEQIDAGGGNGGAIAISNDGAMTLDDRVVTTTGAISLQANGPITVNSLVSSQDGQIGITSGPGYNVNNALTIGNAAVVSSASNTVTLTATSYVSNGGSVQDRNGAVTVTLVPESAPSSPEANPNGVTPSRDICITAPTSALCQALSPASASESGKPVQAAMNDVIKSMSMLGDGHFSAGGNAGARSTPDDTRQDGDASTGNVNEKAENSAGN